jgi:hypothetical protein
VHKKQLAESKNRKIESKIENKNFQFQLSMSTATNKQKNRSQFLSFCSLQVVICAQCILHKCYVLLARDNMIPSKSPQQFAGFAVTPVKLSKV